MSAQWLLGWAFFFLQITLFFALFFKFYVRKGLTSCIACTHTVGERNATH